MTEGPEVSKPKGVNEVGKISSMKSLFIVAMLVK